MREFPLRDDELVLRIVEQDDLTELYELIYKDDNPEWKKWDAPYYPLEHEPYERFVQHTLARLEADQKAGRPASLRIIEADGEIVGLISLKIRYRCGLRWELSSTNLLDGGGGSVHFHFICGQVIYLKICPS
ncbi:RimJ/RimL family protein N-acetyltransferase [Paenibacillus intestini]|nr:RimJ/RimL family protein N-acetyltransferase [Paenibacillus intestini]